MFIVFRFSAIPLAWRLSATALVAIVLIAAASDHYWEQMGTITSDADYNHTSESGRLQIWSRGIGYMVSNPLLGVGPGNFQAAEGTLSPLAERQQYGIGVRWNAPHNSFVQIGAELGFPGLAFYIAVIGCAFVALRRGGDLGPALTRIVARLRRRIIFPVARVLRNAVHAGGAGGWTAEGHDPNARRRCTGMLRIAQLIESDGPGGAERVVADLATNLQAAGAESVVFVPANGEGWLARQLAGSGVDIEHFHLDRPVSPACARSLAAASPPPAHRHRTQP